MKFTSLHTSLHARLPVLSRSLLGLALATLAACGSTPPGSTAMAPEATSTPAAAAPAPIKIGIALGGGAAKGFAHIGVIKMLEANGFTPAVGVVALGAGVERLGAMLLQAARPVRPKYTRECTKDFRRMLYGMNTSISRPRS